MLWNVHYFLLELFQSLFFYLTKQQILLSTIDILLIEVNLAHAHTKTVNVMVSLCVYRGDFYELCTLIFSRGLVLFLSRRASLAARRSLCN